MIRNSWKMNLWFLVPVSIVLFLIGCSFLHLKEQSEIMNNSTVLAGRVTSTLPCDGSPVIVAAYTKIKNRRSIVHHTVLQGPGPYELMVPRGDYYVVAFADRNRNLVYDKDEPAGQYSGSEKFSASPGGVAGYLDIVLTDPGAIEIDFPAGSRIPGERSARLHYTSPGVIANLGDPLFSDEYARKGYWSALEFFKKVGGNIYFLEGYDPNKTPVLFVHGACGSPRGWKFCFANIDRDKFQPWFFYYPSGAPIEAMSYLLFWKIYNLQAEYQFNRLCVVAHSMGGLVTRAFFAKFAASLPLDYTFISISTPWGGDKLADMGVKYSPGVIPVWKDIQAGGPFIKSLYRKKLPATVEHYLFFSYRGNHTPLRPNNDEVVTLASQLDLRAQAEAERVYGFDEDHGSILSSEPAIAQINAILAAGCEHNGKSDASTDNMLRVSYSYDYPDERPKPRTAILLRSADTRRSELVLYLKSHAGGQEEVGPISPGKYHVSLVANAFTSEPRSIQVIIRKGATPAVHFLMKPQGCLMGYIVDNNNATPVGAFSEPDNRIRIKTITLSGLGIRRTLVPSQKTIGYFDRHLSGTDFAAGAYFYFYNLPEGRYKLSIHADGYLPYSGNYTVRPGLNYNQFPIALHRQGGPLSTRSGR